MVGQSVQQRASQSLRAEDLGPIDSAFMRTDFCVAVGMRSGS